MLFGKYLLNLQVVKLLTELAVVILTCRFYCTNVITDVYKKYETYNTRYYIDAQQFGDKCPPKIFYCEIYTMPNQYHH